MTWAHVRRIAYCMVATATARRMALWPIVRAMGITSVGVMRGEVVVVGMRPRRRRIRVIRGIRGRRETRRIMGLMVRVVVVMMSRCESVDRMITTTLD